MARLSSLTWRSLKLFYSPHWYCFQQVSSRGTPLRWYETALQPLVAPENASFRVRAYEKPLHKCPHIAFSLLGTQQDTQPGLRACAASSSRLSTANQGARFSCLDLGTLCRRLRRASCCHRRWLAAARTSQALRFQWNLSQQRIGASCACRCSLTAVSYTHLTLPTICSV